MERLLVVLLLCVSCMGQQLPTMLVDSPPLAWVHVSSRSDPGFLQQVSRAMNLNAYSKLERVLPYSVVVTNAGTTPISAIGIRFAVTTAGKIVNRDFFYQSFNQPAHPILAPGVSRLFTPLKAANAVAAGAPWARGGGDAGPSALPSEAGAIRMLDAADGIRASIDLVVAPDGRLAGPDKMSTVWKLTSQMRGYSELREQCLEKLRRNDSDESMERWLNTVASQSVLRDMQSGLVDRSTSVQIQYAKSWLTYFRNKKRSDLESELTQSRPEVLFSAVLSLRGGLK
jgi:hypothetical protein